MQYPLSKFNSSRMCWLKGYNISDFKRNQILHFNNMATLNNTFKGVLKYVHLKKTLI